MDFEESDIQARYPDKFVCADCFDDDHLKSFIEDSVARRTCSYCGKQSLRKNIAAPIDADFGDTTAFTYIALNVDRKLSGRPLGAGQARPQATKPGRRRGSIR
jgi:Zn ribbon nucleic-acid-binding protein